MSQRLPVIGIPCDVFANGLHPFHGAGEKYINAVAHGAKAMPMLLPAFGEGGDLRDLAELYDVEQILDRIDGLFLTGSPSNIQPHHYNGAPHREGTHEDRQRDSLTLKLIRAAIARGMPILAVCRGYQELNVALGGSLHSYVHELEQYNDHRENKHADRAGQYGDSHPVAFVEGGRINSLTGLREWQVNSLHGQGLDRLADSLKADAHAPDGLVEAVYLDSEHCWAVGVQWHPEWRFETNKVSLALFGEFGRKVAEFAAR